MRTTLSRYLVQALVLAAPALAMAAGPEGDHGHDKGAVIPVPAQGIAPLLATLVVFGVVFGILSVAVWPKIAKGLSDRENKIRSEIDAAEQARAQARAALETYQKNLAEANSKAQQMIAEAKAAQQASLAEQRAKADSDLAMMKDKAMREIEAAKKQALAEIYAQTASLATGVAGRILQREVNGADAEKFTLEAIGSFKNN